MNLEHNNQQGSNHDSDGKLSETEKLARLKSAQTLATIGIIAGPVSMLYGGVLLSSIALICAIIAFCKTKKLPEPEDKSSSVTRAIYRQAIVAIVVSALALVLNAVSLAMMLPVLMNALQSGSYDQLFSLYGMAGDGSTGDISSSSASDSASSIWG